MLANRKTNRDYRQRNGDARVLNYRGVCNAGVQLSEKVRLYSFGTYNYRRGQAVAPWVLPSANPLDLIAAPMPTRLLPARMPRGANTTKAWRALRAVRRASSASTPRRPLRARAAAATWPAFSMWKPIS